MNVSHWMCRSHSCQDREMHPEGWMTETQRMNILIIPRCSIDSNTNKALDLIISSINDRFDQPGHRIYRELENLLLKAVQKEDFEDCLTVKSFYHSDINAAQLRLHLNILACNFPDNNHAFVSVMDIKECVQKMSPSERQLIAEVSNLLQLFTCCVHFSHTRLLRPMSILNTRFVFTTQQTPE